MANNATSISQTCPPNAACAQQNADAQACTFNIISCELPAYVNCGYDPVCTLIAWSAYCASPLNGDVQTDLDAYNSNVHACDALLSQQESYGSASPPGAVAACYAACPNDDDPGGGDGGDGGDPCPLNQDDCGQACLEDSCYYGYCNSDYYFDRGWQDPPPGEWCGEDQDELCTGWCDAFDPIILDLTGTGYSLTSAANGVLLSLPGGQKPSHVAWTRPNSTDGWLVLDVNGNGQIDGATEMFGNLMPQPAGARRTGFTALAQYDLPANGGNGDGQIDPRDTVFSKLHVWVDANHNGIAEPGELLTLQQLGIASISLNYQAKKWTDAYGNRFRYRAKVEFAGNSQGQDHWAYDVALMAAK